MLGGQILKRNADQQYKTLVAQQAWVRRQWGAKESSDSEEEAVGNTYLGDIHHSNPQPIIVPQQQASSSLGPLLAAALGMLGPAGAVGGYFLNEAMQSKPAQSAPVVVEPKESTTINNREELDLRILTEDQLR